MFGASTQAGTTRFTSDTRGQERRANSFQLLQVQDVVAGTEPLHVREALLAALAVDPDSGQLGGAQALPDADVGATKRGELVVRVADVSVAVFQMACPEVLIVAHQRGP